MRSVSLKSSKVDFSNTDAIEMKGFSPTTFNGKDFLVLPAESGWFALKDIDLTGIASV